MRYYLSHARIIIHCTTYIHLYQVARLYRKSLKVLSSWVIDRDIFVEEATKLRDRFDMERGCSNAKAVRLLKVRNVWCNLLNFFLEKCEGDWWPLVMTERCVIRYHSFYDTYTNIYFPSEPTLILCVCENRTNETNQIKTNRRGKPNYTNSPIQTPTVSPSCQVDHFSCVIHPHHSKFVSPMGIIRQMPQGIQWILIWVFVDQKRGRLPWAVCWLILVRRIWNERKRQLWSYSHVVARKYTEWKKERQTRKYT